MQRDLIGYGGSYPKFTWPNQARVALNFVLNYEEGAEANILDGDEFSEAYLTDLPGITPLKNQRHLSVESLFEYGSRAGSWRLLGLFERHQLPLTIFATGIALERNPPLVEKLKRSPHEIAGHGYRWINYREVSEVVEREHIRKTIALITALCSKKVNGWYTGRRSPQTRQLVAEEGLRYDSDSYADDVPYWTQINHRPHLIIPYQLDTNDARYALSPGWSSGEDFFQYLKASFTCLYKEGAVSPKMMTVGLHPRLSGRPGRCEVLERFILHVKQFEHVWICRREEIADYWYEHHPL